MHLKKIIVIFILLHAVLIGNCQSVYKIPSFDGQIHAKSYGKGEPILIINGGPGMNSNGFDSLAKILGVSNQVIIFDQRGTGKSKVSIVDSASITIDRMVEDIETIRKYFKIKKWIVFGHSFGGMLASYYASKFPKKAKGLILSSSGGIDMKIFSNLNILGKLNLSEKDSFNFYQTKIANGDTTYLSRFKKAKFLASAYLYYKSENNINTIAYRMLEADYTIGGLVVANMYKIRFDCKDKLSGYDKPVLILQGKEDFINEGIARSADSAFKKSDLFIIEKCGHYGWLDQPEIYFDKIHFYLSAIKND
jgi:proline iminopeptidase